jgi:hypothetical protein
VSYGELPGGQGAPGGPQDYGEPPGYGTPKHQGGVGYGYGAPAGAKPPTYRGMAITAAILGIFLGFISILIGLPAGIAASVYGRKVDTAWAQGDPVGAATASRRARTWLIVSATFDAISLILAIVVIARGGASSTG